MKSNFKKYLLILVLLAIIVGFATSCKKDYPSDIPQWLKEKIREYKQKTDDDLYHNETIITELKNDTGDCIYEFKVIPYNGGASYYTYYDLQGNKICSCQWCIFYGDCLINGLPISQVYKTTRSIWYCRTCKY